MSRKNSIKKIVCCYTHKDQEYAEKLDKHLALLQRLKHITFWIDKDIRPGMEWESELAARLDEAEIILLLISADFLASYHCYEKEMEKAMKRHERGEAHVIPIIVRPVDWEGAPFGKLRALPEDAKAITMWRNEDEAFKNVAEGVRQVVLETVSLSHLPVSTGQEAAAEQVTLRNICNIPYRQNPLFTGREAILAHLHSQWHENQVQVIAGMGGIGKTQIAVEFAYRHQHDYQALLWCLAESREALTAGYVAIAKELSLPAHNEPDQTKAVQAVIQWLGTHQRWLLILDNADDLSIVYEFLPASCGHILLTSRASSVGNLTKSLIEVDVMEQDIGTLFLLRRAKLLAPGSLLQSPPDSDRAIAGEICKELGGLPLALDQAGAYIEETQSDLLEYLRLYREYRVDLLKRRGNLGREHPESVAVTFSLSFQKVEQVNPAAADLLRLCAFLAPDAIPESIITDGARHLGPLLQEVAYNKLILGQMKTTLLAYSLIRRNSANQTLSIHRLVQAVIREVQMAEQKENTREWVERTICAVNAASPPVKDQNWQQCELLLPHALLCEKMIEEYQLTSRDAARLLQVTGDYLGERLQLAEAERLLKQALSIREHLLGNEHLETAISLQSLAWLYDSQINYAEAEVALTRAISIFKKHQEPLLMAISHKSLGWVLTNWGKRENNASKYETAESHHLTALSILKKQVEQNQVEALRLEMASGIHELARLYEYQKKYELAESQYQFALSIREELLGPQHYKTAQSCLGLIKIYQERGQIVEAIALTLRTLQIDGTLFEREDPELVNILHDLAQLLRNQDTSAEILPLLMRALSIYVQHLDMESVRRDLTRGMQIAQNLSLLMSLVTSLECLRTMSDTDLVQYLQLFQPFITLIEQTLGKEHPLTVDCFQIFEEFYQQLQEDFNQSRNESEGPS